MKRVFNFLLAAILMGCFATHAQEKNSENKLNNQKMKSMKILFVLTSHSELGTSGEKTGFWVEEFATPYYFFTDKGIEVTIASPKGGQPPIDPKSNLPDYSTPATKRFYSDKAAQEKLSKTITLSEANQKNYDAIFYPGGHGPMWDLAEDKKSIQLIESFYNNSKPVAFVCHGPAALRHVKDKTGAPLVKGKKVTGFTNTEEEAVQLTKVVPFSLEDMLKSNGAIYARGNDWNSFAVVDGLLITGQNPASSELVAEKLISVLREPRAK